MLLVLDNTAKKLRRSLSENLAITALTAAAKCWSNKLERQRAHIMTMAITSEDCEAATAQAFLNGGIDTDTFLAELEEAARSAAAVKTAGRAGAEGADRVREIYAGWCTCFDCAGVAQPACANTGPVCSQGCNALPN